MVYTQCADMFAVYFLTKFHICSCC